MMRNDGELFQALLHGVSARWLVTGGAGFIGSHIVEVLLRHGQSVRVVDNFATGHWRNIEHVIEVVGADASRRLEFIEEDISDAGVCERIVSGSDFVLHQAALGSVPRSIENPLATYVSNTDGFIKLLTAAKNSGVRRLVYASSSSVYGDSPSLPKVESEVGRPLSPYAATKVSNELFADVYARVYGICCVGLRYFNVFGPRQDPLGPYAAVVPQWIDQLLTGKVVYINGDGQSSRDFCYVANVVQANLLAALTSTLPSRHEVFNIAVGQRTTLLQLFDVLQQALGRSRNHIGHSRPAFRDFRAGDVRHSLASIDKAVKFMGYAPSHDLSSGVDLTAMWYARRSGFPAN